MNVFRKTETGSALFMILIGVALFAALSYTVADMMRSGNPEAIGEERAKLYADEILDYAQAVRRAVQDMRINGCSDTEISFENDAVAGYTNGTNTDCQVFHTDGGGLTWIDLKFNSSNPGETFSGSMDVENGIGSSAADLFFTLGPLPKDICLAINDKLGITNPSGNPPYEQTGTISNKFTGSYSVSENVTAWVGSIQNQQAACMYRDVGGTNFFYQVLISR